MSRPSYRRTILLATAMIALMAARPVRAQNPIGLAGDLLVLKAEEWRLEHDRARLQADIDRGDAAAVSRHLRRVRKDENHVEFVRWLARSDLFLPLAFTTQPQVIPPVPASPTLIPHPQYPGYGYFTSDPTHLYRLPRATVSALANPATSAGASADPAPVSTAAPAGVNVEIVNARASGTAIEYAVDGVAYKSEGGGRQKLAVGPASIIAYDRGGGLGEQRYTLSEGEYEFRSGDAGWSLVKLIPTP